MGGIILIFQIATLLNFSNLCLLCAHMFLVPNFSPHSLFLLVPLFYLLPYLPRPSLTHALTLLLPLFYLLHFLPASSLARTRYIPFSFPYSILSIFCRALPRTHSRCIPRLHASGLARNLVGVQDGAGVRRRRRIRHVLVVVGQTDRQTERYSWQSAQPPNKRQYNRNSFLQQKFNFRVVYDQIILQVFREMREN